MLLPEVCFSGVGCSAMNFPVKARRLRLKVEPGTTVSALYDKAAGLSRCSCWPTGQGWAGEVDVLQAALAVGRQDRHLELGVELSLVAHGLEDDLPPGFEIGQVVQPLLQRAELRIVQRSGDFLAVARDERDAPQGMSSAANRPLPRIRDFLTISFMHSEAILKGRRERPATDAATMRAFSPATRPARFNSPTKTALRL